MLSPSTVSTSRLSIHATPKKTLKDATGRLVFTSPQVSSAYPHLSQCLSTVLCLTSLRCLSRRFGLNEPYQTFPISFHSARLAPKKSRVCCTTFSKHLKAKTTGYGMYGFRNFFVSLSRFTGMIFFAPSDYESNSGRLKSEREQKALAKEDLRIRWKAMLDLCSVIACHSAFEDCMDGDSIGLGMCQYTPISRGSLSLKTTSGH